MDVTRAREGIEAACRVLEGDLTSDPTMEELAQVAGFSMFHFHRLFRGLTGETVRGYSRRLRLERAAYQLEHTREDLLGIALGLGYGSHEAFTRAFQKRFGVAPSDYRQGRRESPRRGAEPAEALEWRVEDRGPCTVACVRHVGPYSECGEAWRALMKWGWSKLLFGSPEMFGLCHDDPEVTEPERVRFDACLVVARGTRPKGRVELRDLPAAHFAVALHRGDYGSLGTTYAALLASISEGRGSSRRWTLGDPPGREVYLNDPRKTRPSDLRTEVWIPLHPA